MPHAFLIVDDSPPIRGRLRELLASVYPEATFTLAGSVEEMDAFVPFPAVTAVLLDVELPGRSGIAALPSLRAQLPDIPIVVLSACPPAHYAVRALNAGASAFVPKERASDDLVPLLAQLLEPAARRTVRSAPGGT